MLSPTSIAVAAGLSSVGVLKNRALNDQLRRATEHAGSSPDSVTISDVAGRSR